MSRRPPSYEDSLAMLLGEDSSKQRMAKAGAYASSVTPTETGLTAVDKILEDPNKKALVLLHSLAQTRSSSLRMWNEMYLQACEEIVSRALDRGIENLSEGELVRLMIMAKAGVQTDKDIISASAHPSAVPPFTAPADFMVTLEYGGMKMQLSADSQERIRKAFEHALPADEDVSDAIDI